MAWETALFTDVVSDVTSGNTKLKTQDYKKLGKYPVIDQGASLIGGYSDENISVKSPPPYVIFGDHTCSIKYVDFPFILGADGVKVLQPNTLVLDTKYLYFYLKSVELPNTGYDRHFKYLKRVQIPLPPLPEQQRIATLLEKVDHLRQLRQQALRRLDDLVQATFLEMFGDPVTNPKGWETELLSHIALVRSGVTKGRKLSLEEVVSVPYMRVANVQDGYLNLDEIKNISVLPSDVEKYALQSGDLLLTEGGDLDKLGRGAIWKSQIEHCIHQNHIFCVRLETEKVRPEYLSALVGSAYGKRYFLRQAKQTTGIASINSTQLKAFPVQKPSLSLQLSYEAAIKQINTQKHNHHTALTQLDTLFNALMQQAFTGQLQWNSNTVAQAQEQLRLPLPL